MARNTTNLRQDSPRRHRFGRMWALAFGVVLACAGNEPLPPGVSVVSVALSPDQVQLDAGTAHQFDVLANLSDNTVRVVNGAVWTTTGGTITTTGLYTAPAGAGQFLVVASDSTGEYADTSTVTVIAMVGVTVTPDSVQLDTSATQQFSIVSNWSNATTRPVTGALWSATGGAVSIAGLFTSGAVSGTNFRVIGADPTATFADTSRIVVSASAGPPPPPQTLASHDFNNGAIGPYLNPWGDRLDFPDDPTASGRGKVARLTYSPSSGQSMERGLRFTGTGPGRLRYNQTIWFRGRLYIPAGTGNWNGAHNRKLVDYQGGGVRITLHRVGPTRDLKMSIVDYLSGFEREVMDPSTGITLADDTWHTIEMRVTTNSATGVLDGVVEIFMNGSTTPSYRRDTGLGWINEVFPGGSYFDRYFTGFQLTINSGDPVYSDVRYWDDIAFATTRIGP